MNKPPIKGVGRRSKQDTIEFAASALEQSSEGEFVEPLPIKSVRPDSENKRVIIGYLTSISESIISAKYNGKTLAEHLSNESNSGTDEGSAATSSFQDLPANAFLDVNEACRECEEEVDNILNEWRELLTLTGSIHLTGQINQPISVTRDTTDGFSDAYVIEYGHRRYLGAILAGHRTIRAIVTNQSGSFNPLKRATHRWIENHSQKKLTIWENYSELKSYREAFHSRWGNYPSNRKVAGDIGLHPKAVDRYYSVIKAEENNLLTDYFVRSVKSGSLYQFNLISVVNRGISEKLSPEEFDNIVRETIDSQGVKADDGGKNSKTGTTDQSPEKQDDSPSKGQSKEPKHKAPSLKVKDVDMGRRVIRALKNEFFELNDVEVSDIKSLETIDELFSRLF